MDALISAIPKSFVSLVGLAVVIFLFRIAWTFVEEWSKSLYRAFKGSNKEKRHENSSEFKGFERRTENKGVEVAILALVEQMRDNNMLIERFISNWKEKVPDAIEAIDEIKRKQDNNWNRLFDEEIPHLQHRS